MSILIHLANRYRQSDDPLRMDRYIELAALASTIGLIVVAVIVLIRLSLLSAPEPILPAPGSLTVLAASGGNRVTDSMSVEINSRPVFFPSRRPLEAVPVVRVPEQMTASATELAKLKLLGVFGGGDTAGVIVLVEGKKQRLQIGESVKGWKLKSVNLNEAEFSSGGKLETVVLQYAGAKAAGDSGR